MVAWAQIFVGLVSAAPPPAAPGTGLALYGGGNLELYAGGNLELYADSGSSPAFELYAGGSLELYAGGSLELYGTAPPSPPPSGVLLDLDDLPVLDLEDEFILPPD